MCALLLVDQVVTKVSCLVEEANLKSLVCGMHMGNIACRKSPNATSALYLNIKGKPVSVNSNEGLGVLNIIV